MSLSGAELSSIWVEIVNEGEESVRREFEIKMNTEPKVAMELSKFILDQHMIAPDYPIGPMLDNCLIYSQSANAFVKFEPNVHKLKGSRIRIVYPYWNQILDEMSRTETQQVIKRHYLPLLKRIPFEIIPKDKQSFIAYVKEGKGLAKNPRLETINVIWKLVEEAIKKCNHQREANQIRYNGAEDSTSNGMDANEAPVVSTSTLSAPSESSVTINDLSNKRIVNRDHDKQEAERKRQKKANDSYNYSLIMSLSECLGESSADIWKRVSHKLIANHRLTDMSETETKMRFEEVKTTYLKVLKTAQSPFEASLKFGPGFDLLNTTDLRSVVTNDVHDMIIEFKARLYAPNTGHATDPTPAVKAEIDISVIEIDDDDNDND